MLTENAGVRGGGSGQRQHELGSDTLTCEQEQLSCIMYGKALLKERKKAQLKLYKSHDLGLTIYLLLQFLTNTNGGVKFSEDCLGIGVGKLFTNKHINADNLLNGGQQFQ